MIMLLCYHDDILTYFFLKNLHTDNIMDQNWNFKKIGSTQGQN
jgi:hypothetical protein